MVPAERAVVPRAGLEAVEVGQLELVVAVVEVVAAAFAPVVVEAAFALVPERLEQFSVVVAVEPVSGVPFGFEPFAVLVVCFAFVLAVYTQFLPLVVLAVADWSVDLYEVGLERENTSFRLRLIQPRQLIDLCARPVSQFVVNPVPEDEVY